MACKSHGHSIHEPPPPYKYRPSDVEYALAIAKNPDKFDSRQIEYAIMIMQLAQRNAELTKLLRYRILTI